jgi:hypothetical protein
MTNNTGVVLVLWSGSESTGTIVDKQLELYSALCCIYNCSVCYYVYPRSAHSSLVRPVCIIESPKHHG